MLLPTPTQFILFELDLNVKFPLLCLLHFLSDLKAIILRVLKKEVRVHIVSGSSR